MRTGPVVHPPLAGVEEIGVSMTTGYSGTWSGVDLRRVPDEGSEAAPERGSSRYRPDSAWREDVALEMWIDTDRDPVTIRLAGTLCAATGANLASVVAELIAEGNHDFELQTPRLETSDGDGAAVLADIRRVVQHAGGRLTEAIPSTALTEAIPSTAR